MNTPPAAHTRTEVADTGRTTTAAPVEPNTAGAVDAGLLPATSIPGPAAAAVAHMAADAGLLPAMSIPGTAAAAAAAAHIAVDAAEGGPGLAVKPGQTPAAAAGVRVAGVPCEVTAATAPSVPGPLPEPPTGAVAEEVALHAPHKHLKRGEEENVADTMLLLLLVVPVLWMSLAGLAVLGAVGTDGVPSHQMLGAAVEVPRCRLVVAEVVVVVVMWAATASEAVTLSPPANSACRRAPWRPGRRK